MVEAEGRRGGTTLTARVEPYNRGQEARRFHLAQVALSLLVFLAGLNLLRSKSRSIALAFLPAVNGKAVGAAGRSGDREERLVAPGTGDGKRHGPPLNQIPSRRVRWVGGVK